MMLAAKPAVFIHIVRRGVYLPPQLFIWIVTQLDMKPSCTEGDDDAGSEVSGIYSHRTEGVYLPPEHRFR